MGKLAEPVAHIFGGIQANKAARSDDRQLRRRAGLRRATGQRAAIEEKRDARYLMSAARARAAGGGGNLSDPTLVNIFADIEAGGEYNALSRVFDSEVEARSDEAAGAARRREGRTAQTLGILKGIVSFADKYG